MTGIIVLAAGTSSRLGRAKQSLQYKGNTLLEHVVDTALSSKAGPVVVVVGANENEVLNLIKNEAVLVAKNVAWKEGIASSIHAGLTLLLEETSDIQDVILMVCDQPYVSEKLLKDLIDKKQSSGKPLVASSYNDTIGVPALFDKIFFNELLSLKGEEGGKKVLLKHLSDVATIPFDEGSIDIDTMKDYESLFPDSNKGS